MTTFSSKTIWTIAYPIMFGNLAQTLIVLIDTAFLGHVGRVALGASMMAGMYYYVFTTLAWGFSVGVQIIVARRLGEGALNKIGAVLQHGILFMLALGLALLSVLHCFTDQWLSLVVQSPAILEATSEFMAYRHYGIVFVCFNFLFRAFYIGLSNTKVIIYTTLVMAVVNIFLDYVLIFGKGIFPEMGIGGAALASVCAEACAFLFFIIYTLVKLPLKVYALATWHKLEAALVKVIFKLACPTMLQKLLSFGTWFLFFIMVEHIGEVPIAVSGIIRSTYMLICIPVFAFGATSNTLTSRIIGEKKPEEVLSIVYKILRLSMLCIIPVLAFCIFFPSTILSIYTDDAELIRHAIPTLYVACLGAVSLCFGIIVFEAVSGTGNTMHALGMEFVILIFYTLAILVYANMEGARVEIVWLSETLYGGCMGLVSLLYMKRVHWSKKIV
ncbi:MATE family efflux transporter [Bacteroidia bacterium]|nr:MATE family efflux transporter [Bacteroidia bacterium]